jgi:hypothetical protein
MINNYVNKLIQNLPENITNAKTPLVIDLVLDGGIFNGSYLIGALYFLKEMEKKNYIKIDRISGCSIGSVAAFLYYIDGLDLMPTLYDIVNKDFRQTYKLRVIKDLKTHLIDHIPKNICDKVHKKMFICYNDVLKGVKKVKSKYKNIDELLNTIIRSCYIPFLTDGKDLYENKYIDGINPYIFEQEPNKKILHLDLFGYDKLGNLLNVKNEKTNFHRILSGLLDIHSFFIKQTNTSMCSYVNDWTIVDKGIFNIKIGLEKVFIYLLCLFLFIQKRIPEEWKNNICYKILSKSSYETFIILLENYCL